jgi:murein DD-endopeptidase MepM/ murein hydrolase activator NlpD
MTIGSFRKLIFACTAFVCACATTPKGSVFYLVTVEEGDTIESIAIRFDSDPEEIKRVNQIKDDEFPAVGKKLKIYAGTDSDIYRRDQMLGRAPRVVDSQQRQLGKSALNSPAQGQISSVYGMRGWRMHTGIDIRGPRGAPIVASDDGIVTFAGWRRGYGNTVELLHEATGIKTLYAHCLKMNVRVGQRVRANQVIAQIGKTGNATGYHLHFEVVTADGKAVNPMPYLKVPDQSLTAADAGIHGSVRRGKSVD